MSPILHIFPKCNWDEKSNFLALLQMKTEMKNRCEMEYNLHYIIIEFKIYAH